MDAAPEKRSGVSAFLANSEILTGQKLLNRGKQRELEKCNTLLKKGNNFLQLRLFMGDVVGRL